MKVDTQREYNEDIKEATADVTVGDENEVHDLLAGYVDENGVRHTTFTCRDITGADEEYINRPDIKNNSTKVITALLSRCVTSVGNITKKDFKNPKDWEKVFLDMLVGDRDVITLQLRKQSIGEEIEVQHECPVCKAKLKTVASLEELPVTEFDGEYEIPFELPKGYTDKKGVVHKCGTMRRPNGLDAEILTPLAKTNTAKATTTLLTRICKFEDGTYVDSVVMSSLSTKDRQYLTSLLNEHKFGIETTVEVVCDQCGETFIGNLGNVNFT